MKTRLLSLFVALVATTALWASNIITYTATKQLSEVREDYYSGLHINAFNVAITSHEFSNGIGTITFAGEVTTIGKQAFYCCSDLTSVTIGNSVTTIGESAFASCHGLTSVTIPNSVTTIGSGAFRDCHGLTSITVPNSVTTIGNSAFAYCSSLTSVTIPNSVTTIGESAFAWCEGLTSIDVNAANAHYCSIDGVLFNYAKDTLIQYPAANTRTEYTIPNSVTTIGAYTFSGCEGLTSITIPNSVTTIGNSAFQYCSGLTSITIPNSVTLIGDYAFNRCSSLASISIPRSVTTIGQGAFQLCDALKDVYVFWRTRKERPKVSIIQYYRNIWFDDIEDGKGPQSATLHVPSETKILYENAAEWKTFGTIIENDPCPGDYFEEDSLWFEILSMGESNIVRVINDDSYLSLTAITIPSTTTHYNTTFSVTQIADSAFNQCSNLTLVTLESSTPPLLGTNVFGNVPSSCVFSIPRNTRQAYIKAWGEQYNFYDEGVCGTNLNWDYKNGKLIFMGFGEMYDFAIDNVLWKLYRDSIQQIELCEGLTNVGNNAFASCQKITAINIPNSVTTIGESAFEDCAYLKTITLGKALTDIGCNAFKGDFRIEEITSYAEVTPNVCSSTFDGLSKQYIYLYVPENSIRGYQVDPNWNGFDIRTKAADKKPMDGDNPIVTPSDQDVTITWPITDGTDTYTLTITKNGEVICVLTFNANGQLTNIAFAAPSHNGARQAPAATLTAQGYQFTVTGLNPGTAYNYSVTATDAGGQTLAEHKGNFNTTGGTGFESVHDSQCTMHKYFHNGNLIIERNGVKYTPAGQKVR